MLVNLGLTLVLRVWIVCDPHKSRGSFTRDVDGVLRPYSQENARHNSHTLMQHIYDLYTIHVLGAYEQCRSWAWLGIVICLADKGYDISQQPSTTKEPEGL
eukprot:5320834-Amphidinium_carterae.1